MNLDLQDPYLAYYKHQLGHGVSVVYKGAPYQRGHGIGSFLGGLFRTITPLLKTGVKTVGKEALKTGFNVLTDIVSSTSPPKQALSNRMKEFTGSLKRKADEKLDRVMNGGGGYKKKKMKVTPQSLHRLLAVSNNKRVPRKKVSASKKKKNTRKALTAVKIKDIFS